MLAKRLEVEAAAIAFDHSLARGERQLMGGPAVLLPAD
jgi:hypothetical protein